MFIGKPKMNHQTIWWFYYTKKHQFLGASIVTQQCPIFPDRYQSSIFGEEKLNFCVRNENRWFLLSIVTEYGIINIYL